MTLPRLLAAVVFVFAANVAAAQSGPTLLTVFPSRLPAP